MSKKVIFIPIALLSAIPPSIAFADFKAFAPSPQIPIEIQILSLLGILCVDFVVNLIVLCIGYLILGQGKLIASLRFLKYTLLVTIGGILIDLIYVYGVVGNNYYLENYLSPRILFLVLTSLVLAIYNFWLSRKFFKLNLFQAVVIGLMVGIFTNPLWPSVLASVWYLL